MGSIVIIVGAARSGTKYLRDILASAPNASKVPYDINYIWRYGLGNYPDDALPAELATPAAAEFVRAQVLRLSEVDANSKAVVFEKTVSTSLRPAFANAIFPEARFIHLIRDGRAVTESAMRQWEAPPDWGRLVAKFRDIPLRNMAHSAWYFTNYLRGLSSGRGGGAIWGPRYPGIQTDVAARVPLATICARQWRASVERSLSELQALPAARVITVRYEDLVRGDTEIRRLAEFCGLLEVDALAHRHAERVKRNSDSKWCSRLDEKQRRAMLAEIGPLLQKLDFGRGEAVT